MLVLESLTPNACERNNALQSSCPSSCNRRLDLNLLVRDHVDDSPTPIADIFLPATALRAGLSNRTVWLG